MQKLTSRIQRVVCVTVVFAALVVGVLSLRAPSMAEAAQPEAGGLGLTLEPYATGLMQATDIANAGDERLFVTEQAGTIRIIDGGGQVLPTPFLTIPPADICNNYQSGLLGLTFHPDYGENGYFFIHYISPREGTCDQIDQVIARYKVSDSDPNVADPASGAEMLRLEHPFDDNYGGDLAFSPLDGYLYIPLGDGGGLRNPATNPAQDGESLLGKILRLDVSTSDTGPLYTIPADNPYVNDPAVADEIWSMGWRNPFRFSFDSYNGDMYVGDVGDGRFEEINFESGDSDGGENYGWPCKEGTYTYTDTTCSGVLTDPVFQGLHQNNTWIVVTGGYVYRGSMYPLLQGYYIFADFGTGEVYTMKEDDQGEWQVVNEGDLTNRVSISTFGEGANGELYLADFTYQSDTIYHIVDTRPQPQYLYLPAVQRGAEE